MGGAANHHATGNVLLNDSLHGPATQARCYLISDSPDGSVQLNPDGNFSFVPKANFSGSSTRFTYKVCDNSPCSALCSEDATVTINFPTNAFLPISVIDFNGLYRSGGNVVINWITTFEEHSKFFEVQRSMDGIEWETVGQVEAQGVSKNNHLYAYTDNVGKNKAIKRDLYYRLVQVNLDGRTSMSKILVVRVYNTRTVKMICVTPNPVKDDIVATLQLNEKSMVALRVVNESGAVMLRKTVELQPGSSRVQMDGSSRLRPGPYFLEMIVNSRERMIVQLVKD